MRIDSLTIDDFKNLKNFHIDIDETQLTSVFIGRNAGSAGGLHRDFTGVCQTGRNVLRKGSTGLDVQVNQKAPERI